MAETILYTDSLEQTSLLFGSLDVHLKTLENAFDVQISSRDTDKSGGNAIVISGESENVRQAESALTALKKMSALNRDVNEQNVSYVIGMVKDGSESELHSFDSDCVCVTTRGKPIKAKTLGQKKYVEAIKNNTIVLGVGPAGTGKTFLAVAMAATALRNKQISRIVLTRPAVEAGEKLGYLPGDLQNKIDPYLRPLYDAMYEMFGAENYLRYVEKGAIEIAPLAYMRGRTLDDSFIILDEAQNTTPEQMKMFLTRLGNNTKAVVTGDITQTDLPFGKKSGLVEAVKILDGIEDIAIHRFSERDVVRHKLVQKIILAYEKYDKENQKRPADKKQFRRIKRDGQ
ncbi:MAG: phosphate starvation-inducible protein PhoH [Ruminococcaceae bacterium]|nr:phosphate starvation-inducible protein PhoH [Oscillospiraceae bacterium]